MIRAPVALDAPEAEAYRSLRSTLAFTRLPEGRRVVLFTSAHRGEGKSTTSANFAAVCAYGERPTLLVDADLRHPQLHEVFGTHAGVGLSSYLRGADVPPGELAVSTGVPFLSLVEAGPPALNAGELLARPALGELIESARERYEWVIVDAPPVLPIADATIVSRVVDGVVLVVNLRHTSVEVARRARDLLRAVGAPLLGVVANETRLRASAYGYGRYAG